MWVIDRKYRSIEDVSIEKIVKGKEVSIFLTVSVVFILCIFKDFLFYKNVYIFKDIASDTINQFYPHIVHASQYLRTYGIPKWSFNIGIGQNAYQGFGDPFTLILCLLPKAYIPYGIVYVEIAKIITGGLFFYCFFHMLSGF